MEKEERKEVYGRHKQLFLMSICFKLIFQYYFGSIKMYNYLDVAVFKCLNLQILQLLMKMDLLLALFGNLIVCICF